MTERSASCLTGRTTGMAHSIVTEVGRLLEALGSSGENGSIDLHSLPLTEADRQQLEELLGHGEVHVELDLAGRSEIWETGYSGAWWVRHRGAGGRIAAEEIAVCRVPEILLSHPADIRAAARRLNQSRPQPDPLTAAEMTNDQRETPHV